MNRAHGIDISHWQGFYHHQENPPLPVDFVIQKLTEGIYRDPSYSTLKKDIQVVPIRGGYHYFRGQWNWKQQMDVFLSQLEGYHFWALDVEKRYNYSGPMVNGLSPLNQPYPGFIESLPLALEYMGKHTNIPGLIYVGPGTWIDWLKPIHSELLNYDLWVPHYWYKPNPEGTPNYFTIRGAGNMRRDWRFWQYTDKGMNNRGKEFGVNSFGLDLNVFNGSVEDLKVWVFSQKTPPEICSCCGQEIKR